MNGNWTINDIDLGISFYETSIIPPFIGSNGNYYIGSIDSGITVDGEIWIPDIVVPEVPVVTPEVPVVTPEVPVVTPEVPVVTPEVPVVTPEVPVVTPEVPVVTPEVPFEEKILDPGVYRFGYDFSFGGTTGGGSSSGGSSSGGSSSGGSSGPSQSGVCPSDMNVTPLDLEILDIEKIYDGKTLANTSAVLRYDESILKPGEKIIVIFDDMGPQASPKSMPKNIGQYELRGSLSIVDADGKILQCVYKPNFNFIGDLSISPRSFAINTETVQKPFDGSPLTNNEVIITGQGLADGHTLVVVFSGTQTEVGASVNFLDWSKLKVLDENQQDVTKNYSITYNYGMLIVTFAS
jgi:hypothetical protein